MKKRILSVLLLCCMVLGLLPTTVFANNDGAKAIQLGTSGISGYDGAKAIQLGTSGISGYDSTNNSYDYIHFGTWDNSTVKWRVLDTKTNMPNAREEDGFFLLSDALLGTGEYGGVEFDYTTPYFNDWKGSRAQDWCNDFYSRSLSITEQKAVLATSKSDALYGMYYAASDNILDGDKVFFLSAEEAENAAYGFTDDNARIANYGDSAYVWWLRSPRRMNPDSAGTVNEKGAVIGEWVGQTNAARPAFNLKPDSVLLVSAAVGGKGTADGMFKIPEYSGDEWKLTLLDDTRTFRVTETTAAGKPGGTVTLNFSGPRTGQNEYISAIIEGKNGATHYGRIMKPTAADRQLSFTLPHDLASGNYKLHVFSEQYNGDYQTDYASRFQTVALTVEEAATEQFALTPGGTYYFDLSGENIPGTINDDLPDKSMHYVPFTYAGAVNAYKLTSAMATTEEYAQQYKYDHSLFIADHAVTHTVSWDDLNTKSLIFGKDYVAGGVDYTLRAPSVGSNYTGSGNSERGVPQSNECDTMLNKDSGYIQNWNKMYSWGQDAFSGDASYRAVRGYYSARCWSNRTAAHSYPYLGFRPVLEVLNPDTLGSGGLKVVTLDLGGGKLGGSSDAIQIIVKNGSAFTAPASDGMTRPDGNTGSYFMWLDGNGNSYEPGDSVPADVTTLTVQWTAPTYAVTLHANGGTINSGNVTEYTYGVGATLPTDVTRTGYTFKGWYDNESLTGNPVTAIGGAETGNKEYWAKWEANTYTVTLNTNGGTINSGNVTGYTYGVGATLPTADDMTYTGYTFKGWYDNEGLTGFPVTAISDTETGNKEYWAKWEANVYTVTLNTNGGTINNGNVTEYTYGAGATLPTADDMTYTGHTFVGWYDNENLTGSPVTAIGGTETGNKEYWAKWEANTYTVTFYPNGGSVNPVAATTDSSGKLSSLPTPTRGGNYRFDGWYTEQTGGIKVTLNQVYTADTTLYAYWIYTSGSSSSEDRDDPSGNAFITDRPNKDNPTTPTTAKSNSIKVDSKGNAVITRSIVADVISVAQSDSIKNGNTKNGIAVVVPVEISKALAGVQITLKADALDKLVSSGVKRFTIDTDSMADFGFMLDTLKELNRQTTGDLILKMKKTAVTSQEVETAIGNRPVYDITLWEVKNGKETVVNLSGKTVSIAIPYTPAKNEKPGNLYAVYVDENGNVQWISKSSYNMDQKAVIFVAEHFSIYGIGYKNQIPAFTDVNNHWAKDNMLFVVSRGLLSGTSATTFSPNTGMTRGMFVTALGRLAGVDPTDYQASMFTDVKEDAYYAPYVNWAAKTGVVSGTTDTTFAPDTNISREQMAVIMKNYAAKLGYTIPKTLEVVNFADSAGISSWAKEAVKSMQQAGILAGKTNNCFDPAGTATRAEVATVLRRFVEIVIDPQTANGWVQNDSGEWSYYKNGDLVKGWLSNDQKWYWLDKNTGKMFSGGWKQIDGKQYYFYADGSMAVNTTVDGKTIGADGARK